jgi:hypothetical protein
VESALSLYFDLWDSNEDGSLSDEELVTLMEAVQGLLPPTASAAERDATRVRARNMAKLRASLVGRPRYKKKKQFCFVFMFPLHQSAC